MFPKHKARDKLKAPRGLPGVFGNAMKDVRRGAIFALLLLSSGCAHTLPPTEKSRITEYLDPQTAMTVRVVSEPFVYGRDAPELAVNARDYLSVGAVELDNMGKHRIFLALVSWSTIDRARVGAASPTLPERLEVQTAGSTREWAVTSHHPRELGAGVAVLEPPVERFGESWVELRASDIRALAAAPPDAIDVVVEGLRQHFTLWRRGDAALSEFAASLPADIPAARGRRRHVGP